jgi:hypothetical protein
MRERAVSGIVFLMLMLAACSPTGDRVGDNWIAEVDTIGDTIVVHTTAGSVWGGPATLVEELAIGALEGPEELTFGSIFGMAADHQSGVYVFDRLVPALFHFGSEGEYLGTIGREGAGPGEYGEMVLGMQLRRDGRLLILDAQNARLVLYDPDGTPVDHWPVPGGYFTFGMLSLGRADHAYMMFIVERSLERGRSEIGLLHLDTEGQVVDTVRIPKLRGEPESTGGYLAPSKRWTWSPLGYLVVGVSADYSFDLRREEDPVIRVRLDYEPVTLTDDQHAAYEARREWMVETQGQFMAQPIPETSRVKPAYQGIYVGDQGRIWVHRHVPSVPREDVQEPAGPNQPPVFPFREPIVFDVFEPDGTYLGQVPVPERTTLQYFDGDVLWGIRTGEFDEQYAVRLRLVPPQSG